ncbi:family 1 glycosylhydrolase [Deinococcus soli (ex Cha et al. 2016)]|uniref:dTDP-4-dehydrorhamnose reductase n=2 Tax=Deinococcus soli (ex Cha et al. 2016) TaxID=1309411 RepID=A0AAE3XAC8_9DEIO|nr:family 1 glycosylhydrolase [Deinococcus soli (ex Cha et al. 2016)]MDR6218085.1 dTDP-4-dehydrorhamnose reductase [Deinococcus soli (ex Cha et al. 2016)]MDR6328335.1 dTDP-4-dehydrorhamnose reductase [Deinococcus soli (ex Cha et al. 2016)]MDR6751187.1 dTDP-4-dehydrorhamnose reductase [Deinococcus soli (ex Cha et al. 2016)]
MTDTRDAERPPLQLWAGLEPTVNRVHDRQMDQLALTGTDRRPEDMDRLADLGVQAVRFPLLWERTAPRGLSGADWRWGDTRLRRLQARRVQPIVGLVHHGSGPLGTDLLEPSFVSGLVAYARAVARRYPDITAYTPVNEPLTTARFSALYGHWYPHARSEAACWLALKHQLMATVLAMRAIREVQPAAQLIQTEDLGRTFSTPDLAAQADFENERRWLSLDLLCGAVTPDHPLWAHLRAAGASERDLWWFAEHACAPDVLGLNVYVTGERFLDSRVDRYPPHTHGGNGHAIYADVEAVRVCGAAHGGPAARLAETHARYGRPMALTEVHLDCTREEQLRWLWQAWHAAQDARERGADVRAVTAWAAMGACEWNSLLTRQDGHYESGLWDVRAPRPRPTALARLARALGSGSPPPPLATGTGWWARPVRHLYPVVGDPGHEEPEHDQDRAGAPLVVVGPEGALRQTLIRHCTLRGLRVLLTPSFPAHSCTSPVPWAVVHLPAPGVVRTARACAAQRLPLLTFSGAAVYRAAPEGALHRHVLVPDGQAALDHAVLRHWSQALVIRPGAGRRRAEEQPITRHFPLGLAGPGRPVPALRGAAEDLDQLLKTSLNLLIDGETGLWEIGCGSAGQEIRRGSQATMAEPAPYL